MTAAGTDISKRVVVVNRDETRASLLARYLEMRGWTAETVSDPRRVIRRWARIFPAPAVVMEIGGNDPDAFELLAALGAHALEARVVVCTARDLDFHALPVDCVLPAGSRFSRIAKALENVRDGAFTSAAE